MRRRALERFLFRFDKDRELQRGFAVDRFAALTSAGLAPEEYQALASGDMAELYAWGVHPLLIRNFAGTARIDYLASYRDAGL